MSCIASCCVCSCIISLISLCFLAWGFYLLLSSDRRVYRLEMYNSAIEAWEMGHSPARIPQQYKIEILRKDAREEIVLDYTTKKEAFILESTDDEPVSTYTPLRYEANGVALYNDATLGDTLSVRIRPSVETDKIHSTTAEEDDLGGESSSTTTSELSTSFRSTKKTTEASFSTNANTIDLVPLKVEKRSVMSEAECIPLLGEYDSLLNECIINWKLVSLCLVVDVETGKPYAMDKYNRHSYGCNENFQPEKYEAVFVSNSHSEHQGSITVRDYRDPLLSALSVTDFTLDFGWSRRWKKFIGFIAIFFGLLPPILLGLSIYGLCTCCRALRRRLKDKEQ
mmetsp:Transcript_3119/g.11960  ORF Transcript_3119/g.11960 Transcript_3119/m.11960 type:complete len:339 (+) Transcript_3119:53-1069(+)